MSTENEDALAQLVQRQGDRIKVLGEQIFDLLALAHRVANLNADAQEIGPGMLAQLVSEARAAIAKATGEKE